MKRNVKKQDVELRHQQKKRWKKLVGIFACFVVFCTVYALILPAVTMEKTTDIRQGQEELTESADHTVPEEEDGAVQKNENLMLETNGEDYKISVSYDESAEIPEGAVLKVSEYTEDSEEYQACFTEANDVLLNQDGSCIHRARFFDISIMDGETQIEPQNTVRVEISQADDIAEDSEDLIITHATNEGTEVISEVEQVREADGTITTSFETGSFSDYGTISAGDTVTIGVGDTVTLTGSSGNKNVWSASPEGYVTIKESGNDAVVTGIAAGTVTVTHQYKNNKKETFTVIVTDTGGSGTEDGEESVEKEASGSGYIVTVRGNQKVLTDDVTLHVEDYDTSEADYQDYYSALSEDLENAASVSISENSFDFLRMYHIYLTKAGTDGEYIPEGNVNLQVTITYENAPENWDKVSWIGHYKKSGSTVIRENISDGRSSSTGVKQIRVSGNSITFHIQSFSVFPVAALANSGDDDSGGTTVGTDGTVLTGEQLKWIGADGSNEWQIVSGGYKGSEASNKIASNDGNVRVQKNVIPTGTENGFLIYLSIDKKVSWEEVIQASDLVVTTSGSYKKVGETYESIHGNYSEVSPVEPQGGDYNAYEATVTLTRNGSTIKTITQMYYGTVPKCSNATGFLKLLIDGKTTYVTASVSVNLHQDGSGSGGALTYTVPLESLESKFDFADFTVTYDGVSDVMGDYIIYDNTIAGNYSASPTYDGNTNVLSWTPIQKSGLSPVYTNETKTTGWYLNSSELVYKIRLDVTKDGFQSAAEYLDNKTGDHPYDTNASTSLSYHWTGEDANTRSTTFTSPRVRGLLYDITFQKVDSNSKPLSGAVFTLADSDNKTFDIQDTVTGTYSVTGLPWGTYTLTETEYPAGYQAADDAGPWKISLCYTADTSNIAKNKANPSDMRYTGADNTTGTWYIVNKKKSVYVDVIKTDMSYQPLAGAEFSIYDSDPSDEDAVPMEGYENVVVSDTGIIADNMEFEDGKTYYFVETRAPDGYNLPTGNVVLQVDLTRDNPIAGSGGSGQISITKETQEIEEAETDVYVVKIPNNPGKELPATGGRGVLPYTFGGAGFILAALLMYGYSLRCKRERRLR